MIYILIIYDRVYIVYSHIAHGNPCKNKLNQFLKSVLKY